MDLFGDQEGHDLTEEHSSSPIEFDQANQTGSPRQIRFRKVHDRPWVLPGPASHNLERLGCSRRRGRTETSDPQQSKAVPKGSQEVLFCPVSAFGTESAREGRMHGMVWR